MFKKIHFIAIYLIVCLQLISLNMVFRKVAYFIFRNQSWTKSLKICINSLNTFSKTEGDCKTRGLFASKQTSFSSHCLSNVHQITLITWNVFCKHTFGAILYLILYLPNTATLLLMVTYVDARNIWNCRGKMLSELKISFVNFEFFYSALIITVADENNFKVNSKDCLLITKSDLLPPFHKIYPSLSVRINIKVINKQVWSVCWKHYFQFSAHVNLGMCTNYQEFKGTHTNLSIKSYCNAAYFSFFGI